MPYHRERAICPFLLFGLFGLCAERGQTAAGIHPNIDVGSVQTDGLCESNASKARKKCARSARILPSHLQSQGNDVCISGLFEPSLGRREREVLRVEIERTDEQPTAATATATTGISTSTFTASPRGNSRWKRSHTADDDHPALTAACWDAPAVALI